MNLEEKDTRDTKDNIISLLLEGAKLMGATNTMYYQCPKCADLTFSFFDVYGVQDVVSCEKCGCKYVVKYQKGREFLDLSE